MSIKRFKSILFRSAQIQAEIEKEHKRRWPDWIRLLKLKKLRLHLKDRLERLISMPASTRLQPVRIKNRQLRQKNT